MLQIVNGPAIKSDDYYITHKSNGLDTLTFSISLDDQLYRSVAEEAQIYESTEHQTYIIKQISAGSHSVQITCELDLTDWRRKVEIGYSHTFDRAYRYLNGWHPSNWTVQGDDRSHDETRAITMQGPTPLDLAMQVQKDYGCAIRFNTSTNIATIVWPPDQQPSGSYAIESVNLRTPPEYKGRSTNLVTRIYPISRNISMQQSPGYAENLSYTNKVICKVWRDDRYNNAAAMMADAQAMVDELSQPERSWKLNIADLKRLDPQRWPNLDLSLFTVVMLKDLHRGTTHNVQVVEDKVYPYYPERNEITVASRPASVQRTLQGLYDAINNPNSDWMQQLQAQFG